MTKPHNHRQIMDLIPSAFSVWGRLFASFLLISGIMSLIAVITVVQFTELNSDMTDIVSEQMPEIVKVNEIATSVTELASIATTIAEPQLRKNRANFQSELEQKLLVLAQKIERAAEAELDVLRKEIATHISALIQHADAQFAAENAVASRTSDLRWLQADFQSEISPLLLDISFNIDNSVARLSASQGESWFAAEFELLRSEGNKRDLVQEIGREGAFAINAMLQAASATNLETLSQFEDIANESLDRAERLLGELGSAGGLITLRQSLTSLRQQSNALDGIFALSREMLSNRQLALGELSEMQAVLSRFQMRLSQIGESRRAQATQSAQTAIGNMEAASTRIVALTIAGLMAMIAIVVFYVRRRIVARLDKLSVAMRAIARGELNDLQIEAGTDEIGRMGNAVQVFKQSVSQREETLAQLRKEIAEREKAETELVQAGKLAALGQLSAGISHELNQPIAATRYAAENGLKRLQSNDVDKSSVEKTLKKVVRMTDRMGALVKQFSRFARRSDYSIEPTHIGKSMQRVEELFQSRFAESPVSLQIDIQSLDAFVDADPLLLEQVLVNLVANAADSAEQQQKVDGFVTVEGEVKGEMFVVRVSDNGVGLPLNIGNVFDPFVTTKEVGEGTGLGLSISYSIAQDLGGNLRLENNKGRGATAYFELVGSK